MTPRMRQILAGSVVALASLLAVMWSVMHLEDSRAQASLAEANLKKARYLSQRIITFRQRPSVAGASDIEKAELARRSQEAAAKVEIPESSLFETVPEAPTRIEGTLYKEV